MSDSTAAVPHGNGRSLAQPAVSPRTFAVAITLAAVIVNVGAAWLLRSHSSVATVDADESEYWGIATDLRDQGLSGIPARRTLPFPLLLAALRGLVGDQYFPVQLLLSLMLAAVPVVAYLLVRRQLRNEVTARIAAVLFLCWPPFVRYGASIYSDSIALLLFLIFLWSFPRRADTGLDNSLRLWRFALAGLLLGLCLEMKPLYLLYTPIAFCAALLGERDVRRALAGGTALALGCIVCLAPWAAYISQREGHFILVSANDGETLAGGLNPALLKMDGSEVFVTAGGRATWVGPGKWLSMDQTGYLTAEELTLPYSQASALMSVRARQWIEHHPREVAYLSARKLLYMWGWYPFWNGLSQSLFGNLPLLVLSALAAASLWVNRRSWRGLVLFWTLPILSSLVALVSWGSWRFRMPADAGLLILVALLVGALAPRWFRRTSNST